MKLLRSRGAVTAATTLICLGILAGCGDDGSVTQQPPATAAAADPAATPATTAAPAGSAADQAAATTAAAAAPAETRAEILQLQGALLDGQQFDFTMTAGNDVLLWFWAPW